MAQSNLNSDLEQAILDLLATRDPETTICPSEAAKRVAAVNDTPQAWPALMEPVRAAARRLVAKGRIFITQQGKPIDPAAIHGPIRLKLRSRKFA